MVVIAPILIILALLQLLIGLGILFESRRSKQTHQKWFVVMLAVLFCWTITTTILTYVDAYAEVNNLNYFNVVNSMSFGLGTLALVALYVFNLTYPLRKPLNRRRRIFITVGLSLAAITPLDIVSGKFGISAQGLYYEYGILALLPVLYGVLVLVSIAFDAILLYKSAADIRIKQQAVTVLVGLGLTIVHALIFIIVLPSVISTNPLFYGIGYLAPYFYTGFTAYGLVRQGLFSVRSAVARSVGYVISLIALGLLYVVLVFVISTTFFDETITLRQQATFAAVTAALAVLYQVLAPIFNKLTNRLFYRDAYDAPTLIDELNKILVSTIDLGQLLERSSDLIASTLKVDSCTFILNSGHRQLTVIGKPYTPIDTQNAKVIYRSISEMSESFILAADLHQSHKGLHNLLDQRNIDLIVRLVETKHTEHVMGYMLLGTKKSGSSYSSGDIKVLTIIANELVIAIQNALRFQEIQNFNETLQERITQATKKLRQTNEKLRALDQTKDDFISMSSHQLRTPLTSVKGYVSMVLEGDGGRLTPLQRKLLTQAFVSAQRMSYLISDLLNVSRLRTGKFVIDPMPTNLAAIVKDEVGQLEETARGRNLTIAYNKPAHFPTFMLDEMKMRQVIMNFMDNAIYYTPAGGQITVNLVEKPQTIEFTVVDNGIGVPKHEQHRLFSKFYRAHNAKRARPDGTGLGLFMAKKVIMAQGGAIIFKSQEGKGSTFGFTFAKSKLTMPQQAHVPGVEIDKVTPAKV